MIWRSAASAGSRAEIAASQPARSAGSISRASSRYGLRTRHRSGLMGGIGAYRRRPCAGNGIVQIQAAFFPAALNRPFRNAAHRRNLGEREPAEELEVDDLGKGRFNFG